MLWAKNRREPSFLCEENVKRETSLCEENVKSQLHHWRVYTFQYIDIVSFAISPKLGEFRYDVPVDTSTSPSSTKCF